jgi:hypothetical protein
MERIKSLQMLKVLKTIRSGAGIMPKDTSVYSKEDCGCDCYMCQDHKHWGPGIDEAEFSKHQKNCKFRV